MPTDRTTSVLDASKRLYLTFTDRKGVIRYASDAFLAHFGKDRAEVLNASHAFMRSPETPDIAFDEFWGELNSGRPTATYMNNRVRDDKSAWYLTVAIPRGDGILGIYLPANAKTLEDARAMYPDLCAEGSAAKKGAEASETLNDIIRGRGYDSLSAYKAYAMDLEASFQDGSLAERMDQDRAMIRRLMDHLSKARALTHSLMQDFKQIRTEPTNMRILSNRLEAAGGPISVISQNYDMMASETWEHLRQFGDEKGAPGSDPFSRMKSEFDNARFKLAIAGLLTLLANTQDLQSELVEVDPSLSANLLRHGASDFEVESSNGFQAIVAEAEKLPDLCQTLRRQVNGLDLVRLMCRVESGRLGTSESGLIGIIQRLDKFHSEIDAQITQVSTYSQAICRDARQMIVETEAAA